MNVELFQGATLVDCLAVCHRSCVDEREQYEAFTGAKFEPDAVAAQLYMQGGPIWTICVGGEPTVVCGYLRERPGVWQDWLVSTPAAWGPTAWKGVTRRLRKLMDAMLETQAHRLQCISLRSRIQAHAWYRVLGLRQEGDGLEAYGADGQDALMFVRLKVE